MIREGYVAGMFSESIIITNKTGLHARPASDLVKLCKQYESQIELLIGETVINAKSIISVLSGGIKQNTEIVLQVCGSDEETAGPAVIAFIQSLKE